MSSEKYLKITTSFPEEWSDEYCYAESQSNTSLYIRNLIKNDRLKNNKDDEMLKLLKKIVSGTVNIGKCEEISNLKRNALKNIMKK